MSGSIKKFFQDNELSVIPVFMIVMYISIFTSNTVRILMILFLLIYFVRLQLVNID